MFDKRKIKDLQDQLEAEKAMVMQLRTINATLQESFEKSTCLVQIDRNHRLNIFTFVRNGETFQIETFSAMSDDVESWKKRAGIE